MNTAELNAWSQAPIDPLILQSCESLASFEEIVREQVWPHITAQERMLWMSRRPLANLLRPDDFRGVISNIQLVNHDDPYERLIDARERGLKFGTAAIDGYGTPRPKKNPESIEIASDHTKGFVLSAERQSLKGIPVSILTTELWYVPDTNTHSILGRVIRYVARPTIVPIKTPKPDSLEPLYRGVSPERYISADSHAFNHFSHLPSHRTPPQE